MANRALKAMSVLQGTGAELLFLTSHLPAAAIASSCAPELAWHWHRQVMLCHGALRS